jgi:hypothetical protein
MRARDRRGAILEKGAIREGCYTTRLASLELFRLIMLRRVKRLYSLLDLSSHLNS